MMMHGPANFKLVCEMLIRAVSHGICSVMCVIARHTSRIIAKRQESL